MTESGAIAVSIGERLAADIVTGINWPQLEALFRHPQLAFAVVGADRGSGSAGVGLDPTITGASLISRLGPNGGAGVIVVGHPGADHPYNLARRILTLDHLSHGRAGVALGSVDRRYGGQSGWLPGTDDARVLNDTAAILDQLFVSWPLDAFPADQDSGRYVDVDRIVHTNFHGAYSVLGPLTAPGSSQGVPLRVHLGESAVVTANADVVVRRGGDNTVIAAPLSLRRLAVTEWRASLPQPPVGGVLLDLDTLDDVEAVAGLLGHAGDRVRRGTLRDELRLPAPAISVPKSTPACADGNTR